MSPVITGRPSVAVAGVVIESMQFEASRICPEPWVFASVIAATSASGSQSSGCSARAESNPTKATP
ncbi:MAG: hypothetical protein ABIR79_04465, partial [Candidatus Binatia bacterium]